MENVDRDVAGSLQRAHKQGQCQQGTTEDVQSGAEGLKSCQNDCEQPFKITADLAAHRQDLPVDLVLAPGMVTTQETTGAAVDIESPPSQKGWPLSRFSANDIVMVPWDEKGTRQWHQAKLQFRVDATRWTIKYLTDHNEEYGVKETLFKDVTFACECGRAFDRHQGRARHRRFCRGQEKRGKELTPDVAMGAAGQTKGDALQPGMELDAMSAVVTTAATDNAPGDPQVDDGEASLVTDGSTSTDNGCKAKQLACELCGRICKSRAGLGVHRRKCRGPSTGDTEELTSARGGVTRDITAKAGSQEWCQGGKDSALLENRDGSERGKEASEVSQEWSLQGWGSPVNNRRSQDYRTSGGDASSNGDVCGRGSEGCTEGMSKEEWIVDKRIKWPSGDTGVILAPKNKVRDKRALRLISVPAQLCPQPQQILEFVLKITMHTHRYIHCHSQEEGSFKFRSFVRVTCTPTKCFR